MLANRTTTAVKNLQEVLGQGIVNAKENYREEPRGVLRDATPEASLANKDLPDLQSSVCLAEEMGESLGAGEVLLGRLQETSRSRTMTASISTWGLIA